MNKKELDVIKKFIKNQIIVSKDKYDELEQKLYSNSCTLNDRIDYALNQAHHSGKYLAYAECFALIENMEKAIKFFKSLKWSDSFVNEIIKRLELYQVVKRDANKSKNKATGNEIKKADNRENN